MNEIAAALAGAALLTAAPDDAARLWIGATVFACAVIVVVAVAGASTVRGWLGACARPEIDAHDNNESAHAAALKNVNAAIVELKTAVALLDGCVRSQQGQIAQIDAARKETLQLVMQQVRQAVDLLSRE